MFQIFGAVMTRAVMALSGSVASGKDVEPLLTLIWKLKFISVINY
jgi:hypothetical protein